MMSSRPDLFLRNSALATFLIILCACVLMPLDCQGGAAGGFTVNTDSREAVRSFYNTVYQSSEGVPMQTTGNASTCTPGTNSTAFMSAVLRRINWFRAMAGVPATIAFDTEYNIKCQQAAMMISRNNIIDHSPPPGWLCYTADGAEAADQSNLALSYVGPDAITYYMKDSQSQNTAAGHRRWLLYPQTELMGSGDLPAAGGLQSANALWSRDANLGGPRPATRMPYTAWPPAGYVPHQVVYPRWSFGLPGADLNGATVTMKSNGVPVSVVYETYATGYGENSRVWVPMGLNANSDATVFPFNGSDTVYMVAISNIVGAEQSFYVYTVTLFNPAVPGVDYVPPVISGPSQPFVGQSNVYSFNAVPYADLHEWRVTLPNNFRFQDGGEAGLSNFTVNISAGYTATNTAIKAAGVSAFRLAHVNPPTSQTITLNQTFAPKTNGSLSIRSRLAISGNGETARVQISADGGTSWQDVFTQTGNNSQVEGSFVTRNFPLSAYANKTVQVRFNYTYAAPLSYAPVGTSVGWYLDEIIVTNAEVWTVIATNITATTNFTFNPPEATNYNLNVRGIAFGDFPLDWGTTKVVHATNGPPVISVSKLLIDGSQVQLDFTASGTSGPFKLLQADQVSATWTTNGSATLTTNVPGSSYRFTTTIGNAMRLYRVKTP
jgi:hypothetical protein